MSRSSGVERRSKKSPAWTIRSTFAASTSARKHSRTRWRWTGRSRSQTCVAEMWASRYMVALLLLLDAVLLGPLRADPLGGEPGPFGGLRFGGRRVELVVDPTAGRPAVAPDKSCHVAAGP